MCCDVLLSIVAARSINFCNAESHLKQNQAVVRDGAVRILRKQWTPTYKEQMFKRLGYRMFSFQDVL